MDRLRLLGRWAGAALWAVALAPALALVPAAIFDRGPDGAVRPALFPTALTVLDPYVWDCTRNSLVVASLVTILARILGVNLARAVVRWTFWGRTLLVSLAIAGMVIPPAFGAIGLRCLFGPPEFWPGPDAPAWLNPWTVWLAWVWIALTAYTPLVALAAASSLAKIDPVWEDAARLAGASRYRVWRQLVWPVVRPNVARALTAVFTLTLFEPGAPLVLNLRRTLAYQVVESALDPAPGQFSRAAVLALGATLLAGLARLMIDWWGGSPTPVSVREPVPAFRPQAASWARGAVCVTGLVFAALAVWLPVFGLVSTALPNSAFRAVLRDPLTRGYLVNSAILGLAVVAFGLLVSRALAAWIAPPRNRRVLERSTAWASAFPALAVGVGAIALPWLLRAAVGSLRLPTGEGLIGLVVDGLDPFRVPWIALVLVVALIRLPLLAKTAVERRRSLHLSRVDAALTLGATRRQARRTLAGGWLGASRSAAVLTFALAASNVAPALILAPTADIRPVGPAVIGLIDEPDNGLARASALASIALAINLGGLALVARSRSGVPRDGFRG